MMDDFKEFLELPGTPQEQEWLKERPACRRTSCPMWILITSGRSLRMSTPDCSSEAIMWNIRKGQQNQLTPEKMRFCRRTAIGASS